MKTDQPLIAVIDYKAGNLASVKHALERLNIRNLFTNKVSELKIADAIIFPGVGHAKPAMDSLKESNIDYFLTQTSKPILGICLGMQLLFESSEEGEVKGLGIIPGKLKKFNQKEMKVPHIGWNTFKELTPHLLTQDIKPTQHFYYVHSYFAPISDFTIGTTHYGEQFTSIVARDNYLGVQFHPEKSGYFGEKLIQNFISIIRQ